MSVTDKFNRAIVRSMCPAQQTCSSFFFNDTATTEIYTLSLHDALPICRKGTSQRLGNADEWRIARFCAKKQAESKDTATTSRDRKSTRLNSSHGYISYAVFCLKKKRSHQRDSLNLATA